ncbi:MAG TPA: ATP-binding cassette domain-containing protein [Solirubrobacteraceae bacterium]|jgi:ABC-type lipoprotein export system ATPase subunit
MGAETLSVEGVWKGYRRGSEWAEVLANVSFNVEPGEIVAITGQKFAGKTTLLKIAAGLERPNKGTVSLGSRQLTDGRNGLLGHTIRWVNGDGPKLKLDVAKFVGLPLALHGSKRGDAERTAAQALERVGAKTCLGRRWGELSDWQRVLVGLARGFAGSPQVVVIDDLLDVRGSRATEEAADLLRSLVEASKPRCGVLMSTSDLESAMFADRVWSITRKRSLKLMAGQQTDGKVIPFPDGDRASVGGSRGVGSA